MTARELAEEIWHSLLGTAYLLERYLDDYPEVDVTDLEDALVARGVELCSGCGWWFECCELDGDGIDELVGYCSDCVGEREVELHHGARN